MEGKKKLLEYIWLDSNGSIRSKIKITTKNEVPKWNFDGSSTGQAECSNSEVILNPVSGYKNPFFKSNNLDSYIILCECLNGNLTPHISNNRHNCAKINDSHLEHEFLFGIEQEYVIFESNKPYKWHDNKNPLEKEELCVQGEFYCSSGGNKAFGREISDRHLIYCLEAGVNICGTNAEVAPSQWEFQVGTTDMLTVSDDLIVARYILNKIAEEHGCYISYDPKPLGQNWNGSGGHTNFSTKIMREEGGMDHIIEACEKLKLNHEKHMKVYGKNNDKRLTGIHETSNMNNFTFGIGDRGSSVRIPLSCAKNGCGYLEDRRPAANLDPYLVTAAIVETVCA